MDSLPLVMAEIEEEYDSLADKVHKLKMEFQWRATHEWADKVYAIAEKTAPTTVDFGDSPYQVRVLLSDIFSMIRGDMLLVYWRLRNLREEEIFDDGGFIVEEPHFGYQISLDSPGSVRENEHFTSWQENHPQEGLPEYLETLLREALRRRGVLASVQVGFYPCEDNAARGYVVVNLLS